MRVGVSRAVFECCEALGDRVEHLHQKHRWLCVRPDGYVVGIVTLTPNAGELSFQMLLQTSPIGSVHDRIVRWSPPLCRVVKHDIDKDRNQK